MLIDRGHLRHDAGRWRLTAEGRAARARVGARADRRPARRPARPIRSSCFRTPRCSARSSGSARSLSMGGADRFEVEERLHGLERREMLRRERRSSVGGEIEYAFRHVLVRDVAYGQIPRAQRADKHRRAAEWIESLSADRENAPDMLAHHYAQALEYARDSGQADRRSRAAHAPRPARRGRARGGAELVRPPPRSTTTRRSTLWPEDDPDWPDAGRGHRRHRPEHRPHRMTDLLGRARERLAAVGDYAGAAKAEMLVGFRHWNEARTDEAIAARARAHELVDRAEPSPTVALVMSRLAINSMLQGEYRGDASTCVSARWRRRRAVRPRGHPRRTC